MYGLVVQVDVIVIQIVRIVDCVVVLAFVEVRYIVRDMRSVCMYTTRYRQLTSFDLMRIFA